MGASRRYFDSNVIALDMNFMPMLKVSRQHAIKCIVSGRAQVLDVSTWERHSSVKDYSMFKVIIYPGARALNDVKMRAGSLGRGILKRDNHACQYDDCKKKATTVDHVLPRAQGGLTSWSNLVACCFDCNQKKGARTPDQAGMKLKGPIRHVRHLLHEEFHRLCGRDMYASTRDQAF